MKAIYGARLYGGRRGPGGKHSPKTPVAMPKTASHAWEAPPLNNSAVRTNKKMLPPHAQRRYFKAATTMTGPAMAALSDNRQSRLVKLPVSVEYTLADPEMTDGAPNGLSVTAPITAADLHMAPEDYAHVGDSLVAKTISIEDVENNTGVTIGVALRALVDTTSAEREGDHAHMNRAIHASFAAGAAGAGKLIHSDVENTSGALNKLFEYGDAISVSAFLRSAVPEAGGKTVRINKTNNNSAYVKVLEEQIRKYDQALQANPGATPEVGIMGEVGQLGITVDKERFDAFVSTLSSSLGNRFVMIPMRVESRVLANTPTGRFDAPLRALDKQLKKLSAARSADHISEDAFAEASAKIEAKRAIELTKPRHVQFSVVMPVVSTTKASDSIKRDISHGSHGSGDYTHVNSADL